MVETNGGLVVRLLRADVPVQVVLDAQGRIAGLLFQPTIPAFGTLADAVRAVAELPGKTAALVTTDGRVRAAHGADVPPRGVGALAVRARRGSVRGGPARLRLGGAPGPGLGGRCPAEFGIAAQHRHLFLGTTDADIISSLRDTRHRIPAMPLNTMG